MKMKSINKILTTVLSVSMLMGSSLPVLAADGEVEAPIYSLDVIDVIVPTTYAVAFNPEGLTVKTGNGDSTDQILSKNYGIINKSSKDKVITVTLNVTDLNTDSGITFVDSKDAVENAEDGEYKIHLTVIPANGTEVTVAKTEGEGTESAGKATTAAALNDVTMSPATGKEVTLMGGENYIGFKLDKAVWTPIEDSEVTLGTTNSNDVSANYEVTALAAGGAGITAFTFGGEMNASANWSKLDKGIKITVIYGNETAASDLTAIDGTGAMVTVDVAPTFTTGSGIGQIKYSRGAGDDGVKEIKKIEVLNGAVYDGYNAYSNGSGSVSWPAATDESGVITLSSKFLSYFKSGDTLEATVTYETNGGDTKTATVDFWRVITNVAPTFTTGSEVGQINYTVGMGNEGLKEIKKIEMVNGSATYDGYNAYSQGSITWPAATNESGVVTLSSKFISYFKTEYASATVTYETNSGETRTASLDVKLK